MITMCVFLYNKLLVITLLNYGNNKSTSSNKDFPVIANICTALDQKPLSDNKFPTHISSICHSFLLFIYLGDGGFIKDNMNNK